MENLIVYDKIKNEREMIIRKIQDSTAILSDASLKLWEYEKYETVKHFIDGDQGIQLAVMEISNGREIDLTRVLRRNRKLLEMMLVADAAISPMDYLTPDIRACSLLLRPYTRDQMEKVSHNFIAAYFREQESGGPDESLVIEGRDGRTVIPFHSIYYIEAREKKVFIRQQGREYGTYDTLENISDKLPDYFRRCHRSFIFNTRYLIRVKLSDNIIYLENGITVPLSRSFKPEIKELVNGR